MATTEMKPNSRRYMRELPKNATDVINAEVEC